MGKSAIAGRFALGLQTGKITGGGSGTTSKFNQFPATSVNFGIDQRTTTLPPEVSGTFYARQAYKGSVTGSGDMTAPARATTLGHFLYGLLGYTVTASVAVPATTLDAGGNRQGHFFLDSSTATGSPATFVDAGQPWWTVYRDVAGLWIERFQDCKIRSIRIDAPATGLVTAATAIDGIKPEERASDYPSGANIQSVTDIAFTSCAAGFNIESTENGVPLATNIQSIERVSLDLAAQLSDDEYAVGDYFRQDITHLQRSATATLDVIVKDAALHHLVYHNSTATASADLAWSPVVYTGSMNLVLKTTPKTGTPLSLHFRFNSLNFLMMPVGLAGVGLVRATLSVNATFGGTYNPCEAYLVSARTTSYSNNASY